MVQVPLIPQSILRREEVDAAAEAYFRNYPNLRRFGDESDEALKYHLLFNDRAVLQAAGLGDLTEEVAVYNAYYWQLVCAKRRRPKEGSVIDYEQQADQILEYAMCDIDWVVIEELQWLAEEDALE